MSDLNWPSLNRELKGIDTRQQIKDLDSTSGAYNKSRVAEQLYSETYTKILETLEKNSPKLTSTTVLLDFNVARSDLDLAYQVIADLVLKKEIICIPDPNFDYTKDESLTPEMYFKLV